jgi:hypothetical protein
MNCQISNNVQSISKIFSFYYEGTRSSPLHPRCHTGPCVENPFLDSSGSVTADAFDHEGSAESSDSVGVRNAAHAAGERCDCTIDGA